MTKKLKKLIEWRNNISKNLINLKTNTRLKDKLLKKIMQTKFNSNKQDSANLVR